MLANTSFAQGVNWTTFSLWRDPTGRFCGRSGGFHSECQKHRRVVLDIRGLMRNDDYSRP